MSNKFRVYDREAGKYLDEDHSKIPVLDMYGKLSFVLYDDLSCQLNHQELSDEERDNYIIERCSDAKDANGNLIFEGDILNEEQLVEFTSSGFIVRVYKIGFDLFTYQDIHNAKITDNIHDKELKK